ncbi:hypothetical protein ASD79_19355 [Caulobacter sp. Root655]|uniref:hypothetical protein n=1 Tax=Caulobacter sp. Root655 TaxID=1736578 RepID=UPI0006FCE3F8|nr:hypothetical protein [Caulobacter sp. Root655]KRA65082.1 hypothetical protein ASD79_19355 [Caulobacter sp. Root655]
MSSIEIRATRDGWRVCYGEELVSMAREEAIAFQAALDYCSKLFLRGVRAQVTLDRSAIRG